MFAHIKGYSRAVLTTVAGCALLGLNASAQLPTGTSSTFQNSETWEVPGAVLKPGTYTIQVKDSTTDRQILTIVDASGKLKVTFIATAPVSAGPSDSKGQFSFWPTKAGKNKVIRAWLGQGDQSVRQFTYPKTKAVEIAQYSRESVPAIDPESDTRLRHAGNSDDDRKIVQLWLLTATEVAPGKPGIEAKKLESSDFAAASARRTPVEAAPARTEPATVATSIDAPPSTPRMISPAVATAADAPPSTPRVKSSAVASVAADAHRMPSTASDTPAMLLAGSLCLLTGGLLFVVKRT